MIKALIFDFDGIITDTEPIHMDAWLEVLETLGVTFDAEEYHAHYLGLNDRDFLDAVGRLHGRHFDEMEKNDLIERKLVITLRLLEHDIPVLPGVRAFVPAAAEKRLLSICSGAQRTEIEFTLRQLKWMELFAPIIASDAVTKGKPDPEGYIRALEGLQERAKGVLLPEEVVAIEDSPKGVAAAKAAGLKCLAVQNTFSLEDLREADWVTTSLTEVDLETLDNDR